MPFLERFQGYSAEKLKADLIAGLTIALVIVPQSMAYAQLAGLPPYYGLYAALLPPVIAVVFGSSQHLATGPVAVVSLMTSAALLPLATAGSSAFIAYAVILAFLAGLIQLLLGVSRLGLLVNFLSHPVVNGFTNAAAIVIATSQIPQLLGITVDTGDYHLQTVYRTIQAAFAHVHWPTLALGALAIVVMLALKWVSPRIPYVLAAVVLTTTLSAVIGFDENRTVQVSQILDPETVNLVRDYNSLVSEVERLGGERVTLTSNVKRLEADRSTPRHEIIEGNAELAKLMVNVQMLTSETATLRSRLRNRWFVAATDATGRPAFYPRENAPPELSGSGGEWHLRVGNESLNETALLMRGGGQVVGSIPQGLPRMSFPSLSLSAMIELLPMAFVISVLGFMEAISIAKRIGSATGQRINPNRELIGQGLANIAGSLFQSYPVSGSFSRSAVNFQAGGQTGLAMIFSSLVVVCTLLFLTPLLYHLPLSVLAAVIIMAVFNLINVRGFIHAWRAQKYDGVISVITFGVTLGFAPHLEVGIFTGVGLSTALYLYRTMRPNWWILSRGPDGAYLRADRWNLPICKHVAVLAFNRSIIFANVDHLEDALDHIVRTMEDLRHVLIVGYAINELDASGEVTLSTKITRLRSAGYDVSFCGLNDHVLAVMHRTGLYEKVGGDHFYSSVAHAIEAIHKGACIFSGAECPLVNPQLAAAEETPPAAPGRRPALVRSRQKPSAMREPKSGTDNP
ncbi:MAG: SulP family inorganic anion transporter [Acidobacteriota bacterium]